ncbi:MAG: hypothetical protein JST59_15155 [Actinobacteria bacterium]|nr:hypothetical protein [Actinomycetota bacterium]
MTGLPMLAALAMALCLFWAFGGLALRVGGALAFWAGLVGFLAGGKAIGALVALVGAFAWLLGQGHRLLRTGGVRSALAGRILGTLSGLIGRGDRT